MSFTPGPWTGDKVVNICGAYEAGLNIGYLMTHDLDRRKEGEANARLIAAAPELLEALESILCNSGYSVVTAEADEIFRRAEAVIAKARGEGV